MINRDGPVGGDEANTGLREAIDSDRRFRVKVMQQKEQIRRELLELGAKPADLYSDVVVYTEAPCFGAVPGYMVGANPVDAIDQWQNGNCRFLLELPTRRPPFYVMKYLKRHAARPLETRPGDAPPKLGDAPGKMLEQLDEAATSHR